MIEFETVKSVSEWVGWLKGVNALGTVIFFSAKALHAEACYVRLSDQDTVFKSLLHFCWLLMLML